MGGRPVIESSVTVLNGSIQVSFRCICDDGEPFTYVASLDMRDIESKDHLSQFGK